MKNLILLSATLLLVLHSYAQIVNIPDTNFKAALINHSPVIDTNGDGEIQVSEAGSYNGAMSVSNKNISDFTGIEAFVTIPLLYCDNNQLSTLDVSNNTALMQLRCYTNQISTLNVSNNTNLELLACSNNQLTTLDVSNNPVLSDLNLNLNQLSILDVSNNPALYELSCPNNQLSTLDVSNNTALLYLCCYSNSLTTLDVSNNTALTSLSCNSNQLSTLDVSINTTLTYLDCSINQLTSLNVKNGNNINFTNPFPPGPPFNATFNPNLYCIEVDDSTWSTANWTNIDSIAYFSNDCTTGLPNELQITELKVFPNPTTGLITIQAENINKIELSDIQGKQIYTGKETEIDLSQQPQGIYIIKVTTNKQTITKKIIKQ